MSCTRIGIGYAILDPDTDGGGSGADNFLYQLESSDFYLQEDGVSFYQLESEP